MRLKKKNGFVLLSFGGLQQIPTDSNGLQGIIDLSAAKAPPKPPAERPEDWSRAPELDPDSGGGEWGMGGGGWGGWGTSCEKGWRVLK